MGEIASAYVSIYPKFANTFGSTVSQQVGAVGKAAGTQMGQQLGDGVSKQAPKIGQGLAGAFRPILTIAAAGAVAHFVTSSVSAFADFQDAAGAAGVVFGDSMSKITAQAEGAAETMYMSKDQVIAAVNTFGTFGKAAGLAGDDLAGFSTQLTERAADLASFKGGLPTDAVQAFGSALAGEVEPLRRYGVVINEATLKNRALEMGLISSTKDALDPHSRALAVQAEILAQTTDAQGDALRTQDNAANVQKRLAAESRNLSIEMGEKLAPAMVAAQKAGIGFLTWVNDNLTVLAPLAATLGAVALAVGGFVAAAKGIEAVKSAKATISGLGDAFQSMGTKAKIATVSMGAIGIVLTAASIAYGAFAARQEQAKQAVEGYTEAIKADTLAVGDNTRAYAAKRLEDAGALEAAQRLGISLETVTEAALGNADALARVRSVVDPMRDDFSDLSAEAQGNATAADTLSKALGAESQAFADGMASAQRFETATTSSAAATDDATDSTKSNTEALSEQLAQINKNAQANLALSGSQIGMEAAIDAATASVKENGKNLDITTEKGRSNRQALDNIAAAGLSVVESLQKTGASAGKVQGAMDKSRDSFIKAARSMGLSKDEAKALADKLGLIKSKNVTVTATIKSSGSASWAIKVGTARISMTPVAKGGILIPKAFAAGGIEDHVAQIDPGTMRVWAEPETGGESYIPLHPSKRRRSLEIWHETGRRLGVAGLAGGGVTAGGSFGANADDLTRAVAAAFNGSTIRLTGGSILLDEFVGVIEGQAVRS